MTRASLVACALQLCLVLMTQAKTFERCELARELKNQGFPHNQLADWVCLVEGETERRTHVVGPPNTDGSRDHGLFQINDRYWCENGSHPGKECNVKCSDLRTDNIGAASTCAKKIYSQSGFNAWAAWNSKCKGKPLPDLSSCGL